MYHKFEKVTDAAKDKYKIGSTVCDNANVWNCVRQYKCQHMILSIIPV